MPGGLLNIIAYGNQNVFLNNNPSKTFFKCVYAKYTNFGIQKFRIDYNGLRELRLNESSEFTFKIPRYAELLLDNYLVFDLPNIWSPIYPPQSTEDTWKPYEFQWIDNIGTMAIEEVTYSIGGQKIQQYTGEYIYNLKQRDFYNKVEIFDKMTGNVNELKDPANANNRNNEYPNSYFNETTEGSEPSIRGRKLYIPLSSFFSFNSKMAFPLVCIQYNELTINVKIRPLKELFTIKDITNVTNNKFDRIQPNFNITEHAFYRFINPPPSIELNADDYENQTNRFNADVHLISTYCFLTEDESRVFAKNEQKYLLKEVRQTTFHNIINSSKIEVQSNGMVSSWLWFLRRTDAYLRNEWTNYSNYAYKDKMPFAIYNDSENNLLSLQEKIQNDLNNETLNMNKIYDYGPFVNPLNGELTNIKLSGDFKEENIKDILQKFSIIFDGKYRENEFDGSLYNTIEKYRSCNGKSDDGLYVYNFCLFTTPYDTQPSGAINLNKFKKIEFELTTITPPVNNEAEFLNICSDDGELLGVNKNNWDIYKYTYDFVLFEERYNILHIINGNAGLMYSL